MASTIKLKNGSGAPLASDLVQGEPALDLTNKRLYTEDSGGTVIEVGTNPTELQVDNINIDGNAITSTDTNGNITITPNGTGEVDISKVDIDSGTIDGTVIGGTTTAAGSFTTLQADTSLNVDGTVTADGLTVDAETVIAARNAGTAEVQIHANVDSSAAIPTLTFMRGSATTPFTDNYIDHQFYASGASLFFKTGDSTNAHISARYDWNGDIAFYEDTGTTAKFFWDASAESLYIGNTNPSFAGALDVTGTITSRVASAGETTNFNVRDSDLDDLFRIITDGTTGEARIGAASDTTPFMTFYTGASERMRIDSSGNLLVGKTTAGDVSINGCELSSSGFGSFSRDGNTAGYFNRDTSDGAIVDFRKDGATVGSIGTNSGSLFIASPYGTDSGLRIGNSNVSPATTAGAARDAAIDLGYSSNRFKDLYLSGTGFFGKTADNVADAGVVISGDGSTSNFTSGSTATARFNRLGSDGTVIDIRNDSLSVGTISVSGSSTAYNTSSDYRLKENVVDMTGAVDRVKALNPSQFNFIADPDTTVDGFLAHEVADVVPEAVTGTKDAMTTEEYEVTPAVLDEDGNVVTEAVMGTREVPDYQGIDQSKLVPLLTGALQEAIARIETLEAQVATLQGN